VTNVASQTAKDAQYHLLQATAAWEAFAAGMQADLVRDAPQRARARAERQRETTYARGELGGH
jgi:hypothetical protein